MPGPDRPLRKNFQVNKPPLAAFTSRHIASGTPAIRSLPRLASSLALAVAACAAALRSRPSPGAELWRAPRLNMARCWQGRRLRRLPHRRWWRALCGGRPVGTRSARSMLQHHARCAHRHGVLVWRGLPAGHAPGLSAVTAPSSIRLSYDHFTHADRRRHRRPLCLPDTRRPVSNTPPPNSLIPPVGFRPVSVIWKALFSVPRPSSLTQRKPAWNPRRHWSRARPLRRLPHAAQFLGAERRVAT